MPIVRLPGGGVQQIPDTGKYQLRSQHMRSDGTSILNEFTFDLDQGVVYNETFEQVSPFGSPDDEAPYAEPKKIGGGEQPISAYLHHPEVTATGRISSKKPYGFVEPGHPHHWATRGSKEDTYRRQYKTNEAKKIREAFDKPKMSRKMPDYPHYASAQERLEKTIGEDMPHLTTGMRVRIPDPLGQEKYAYGTVVEMKDGIPKGYELLCMDIPSPQYCDEQDTCGEEHGLIVKHSNMRSASSSSREKQYAGLPDHIGMFVPEAFEFQNQHFDRNSLGRVLKIEKENISMRWLNVRNLRSETFFVPAEYVRWCRYDPETLKIKRTWYTSQSPLSVGDILVYKSEKACHVSGSEVMYAVTRGVLLQHAGYDSDRCCVNATIMAGMPAETIGMSVRVRKQDVRKFEEPFIREGKEVEIVAEVVFKKKNLQGRRGRVVLATDYEGDVGVEFPEDMNAGSLDGAGREGRCLYIPTGSVKEISE